MHWAALLLDMFSESLTWEWQLTFWCHCKSSCFSFSMHSTRKIRLSSSLNVVLISIAHSRWGLTWIAWFMCFVQNSIWDQSACGPSQLSEDNLQKEWHFTVYLLQSQHTWPRWPTVFSPPLLIGTMWRYSMLSVIEQVATLMTVMAATSWAFVSICLRTNNLLGCSMFRTFVFACSRFLLEQTLKTTFGQSFCFQAFISHSRVHPNRHQKLSQVPKHFPKLLTASTIQSLMFLINYSSSPVEIMPNLH